MRKFYLSLAAAISLEAASGFAPNPTQSLSRLLSVRSAPLTRFPSSWTLSSSSPPPLQLTSSSSSWSVTDDWNDLSQENPRNGIQSEDVFNQVLGDKAAWAMQQQQSLSFGANETSAQDQWLQETVDRIYLQDQVDIDDGGGDQTFSLSAKSSSSTDEVEESFLEEMGEEISLLIRCNEDPTQLLIRSGRALPPLTRSERDDLSQLLDEATWEPTVFLKEAVASMFKLYGSPATRLMDRTGVAEWFSVCSGQPVGPHDPRVQSILSRFGDYGRGALTEGNLLRLYAKAILGGHTRETIGWSKVHQVRREEIAQVWRDIRNHGILGPVELERQLMAQRLEQDLRGNSSLSLTVSGPSGMLMDECEIVDDQFIATSKASRKRRSTGPKSSHELVELADDGKTPLYLTDGEFEFLTLPRDVVFIDEESCIGCTQCVLAAPGSFHMTEHDGRARAFFQRKSPDVAAAVSTCPVDCMHYVGFRELKALETARDRGDGRQDHRHFGHSETRGWIPLTPLHVSGRASDSNHKSSWYHYLRNQCYKSKECPQRGCFNCPLYQSNPLSNPHFKKLQEEANHVRAQHFIRHGLADAYRRVAEL